MTLFNMQIGEVAPGGGFGSLRDAHPGGDHGVHRRPDGRPHPEYLGKKITPREIKLAAAYFLTTPVIVLTGTALAMALPEAGPGCSTAAPTDCRKCSTPSPPRPTTTASAFAGLSVNTTWYNTALGLAMLLGRFVPIVIVLALSGSLAGQQGHTPESIGTLPTHRPQFVGLCRR